MDTATSAESIRAQSFSGVNSCNGGVITQGQTSVGRDYNIYISSTGQVKNSEAEEIARWLSPLKDRARQKELSTDRCHVGQWLLDSEEFKYWVIGQPWHLRCYGKAGSGKTFLSSIVVSHLEKSFNRESNPVIFLYLDYTQSKDHKLEDLFGSLLKQLLQLKKSNPVSAGLRQLYDNAKHQYDGERSGKDFRDLFQDELGAYERVYLVVDALDECHARTRRQFQTELCELQTDKLSMIITSRDIEGELDNKYITCNNCRESHIKIYYYCRECKFDLCQGCIEKGVHCKDKSHKLIQPGKRVGIDISMRDEDLEEYVMWKLKREAGVGASDHRDERRHPRHGRKLQGHPALLGEISSAILDNAEGSALLAKLYLDSIEVKECLNHKDIATLLSSFPKKVDLVYEKDMKRISEQEDADIAIRALSRLSCASRPLSLLELQYSLAIAPGTTDFDNAGLYDKEDLLWVTAGLITIDSDEGAVRLVHTTFKEYLEETGAEWFPNAELDMAHMCLTYLNFDAFSQPRKEVEDIDTTKYPFIAYASQHWGEHTREAGPDLPTDIRDLALRVVSEPLRLAAYIQAAWATAPSSFTGWDVREGVTSLHVFAWFGLSTLIPKVIQEGLDVDVRERTYGQTPLMYACRRGHVEVVRQLLDFGARVDKLSAQGRTAMFEAIAHDKEDVVELLLAKHDLLARPKLDLRAGNPNELGQSALMLAARLGCFGIVQSLLQHPDIDVNQQDTYGFTALFLATEQGFGEVVELLLRKPGINVNLTDHTRGRSALILAAESNGTEIVKLLLQSGANPDLQDREGGGTAIMRAIDYGYTSVIEIMLQFRINYQCKDDNGRSLLHAASTSGLPDVIRLFVEKGLDQNLQDKLGSTPLHDASRWGRSEALETLLEVGADSTIKDNFGRTPLVVAWQYGLTDIMSVLQRKGKTDQNDMVLISKEENLPIWSLVRLGRSKLIADAITAKDSNITAREPGSEDTALHWAINANQVEILRILLKTAKMDPNSANYHRRTPLHLAALYGYFDAMSVLLNNGANLDATDRWGDTPLSIAYDKQHFPVAIALIEVGARIDAQNVGLQKMFFAAIKLKSTKAAEILIDAGANVVTKDAKGKWAMQLAMEAEDGQMITYLKSVKSFPYQANEENSKEGDGEITSNPSPSPKKSSYVMSYNYGEWGGEFDPLSDPEERRVLFAALDSFRQYRHQTHHTTTHLRRQSFYALPSQHTALLSSPPISFLSTLDAIDAAISSNALIAERILSTGLAAFNLPPPPTPTTTHPSRNWHGTATSADLAKARTIVRQLYRDWSAGGTRERRASYDPVMQDLDAEFGPIPASTMTSNPRRKPKILIPGAGLGRLVFDLSQRGYDAEGNEISYHALLAGSWVLNYTTRAEECELFPWVGGWSNHMSRRNQLRSVWVPDVCPAVAIAEGEGRDGQGLGDVGDGERARGERGEMSITASDFLLLYSDAAHAECYDAVATVFFIDTAPNLLRYVETIWHCLVPGGVWVNVGPLLWHWEEGGGPTREDDVGEGEGDEDGEERGDGDGRNGYGKEKWTGGRKRQEGIAEPGSVELTDEEVRTVVEKMGFRFEKHEVREPEAGYIQDPDSMLLNLYRVSHWVARKVS